MSCPYCGGPTDTALQCVVDCCNTRSLALAENWVPDNSVVIIQKLDRIIELLEAIDRQMVYNPES